MERRLSASASSFISSSAAGLALARVAVDHAAITRGVAAVGFADAAEWTVHYAFPDDESTAGFRLARLAAILPVTTPTLSPQRIAPTIQRPGEGYQISPVHAHKHSTRGVRKDPRIAWDDAASGSLQAILDDGDVQVDSHIYSVGVNCEDNSGMQLVIDVIDNGEAEYDDHE
ncbi:hypothetical protein MMC19_004082 [Ptychographa xylographoides]|nr:hypothetical protein [Ptychographa xylographoides]